MKKLYMKKLGMVMLMVGLGLGQVSALITFESYTVSNKSSITIEDDVKITGTLTVANNGSLSIKGNLTVGGGITIGNGGVLIVKGNLTILGGRIDTSGKIVVVGNFVTHSGTNIENNGDLIVGGDLVQNGTLTFGSNNSQTRIFVINPDVNPVGVSPAPYGGYDDLPEDVKDIDIIKEIIYDEFAVISGNKENKWIGSVDTDWGKKGNWSVMVPGSSAKVVIAKDLTTYPEIKKGVVFQVKDLTVEVGASLTLKPGARLTVNGKLTIADGASLIMEHEYGEGGMSSLITNGEVSGKVRTRMELPQDQWFYLGSSRKDAIFSDFGAGKDGISISAYRSNKYWPIKSTLAANALRSMEGIATNFLPSESDKDGDGQADSRLIEYKGEIHTDVVSRTFDIAGFHLLANPYPAFVDWQGGDGWERADVDPTIWYRAKIGEEMAFVTYTNEQSVPQMARIALSPYESVDITPEVVQEHSLVAPMQAVWIKTLKPGVTTTISPSARKHGMEISRLKSSSSVDDNVIRIEAQNAFSRDGAVIFFADGFTEAYESGDAEKYFNDSKNIPEVYTRAGNRSLAINGLSELTDGMKAIPLSVRNRVEGEVSLSFDMRYFNGQHTVYLEDTEEGAFINLAQQSTYKYEVKDLGENHDRFVLHLYKITTAVEEASIDKEEASAGNEINIKSLGNKVLVSVSMDVIQEGAGQIEVYTIDGSKLNSVSAHSSRTLVILPNENGVYIIRAKFGNLIKSERVLVSGK